ncbi:MAG: phage holin family protein [Bacilli bacterium]|nr:phage holin family protein [Bacilli bacterium]
MLKITLTLIFGFLGRQIGGFDTLIITLLTFITMDYITGVMKAIVNKKLSSEIGYKGIFKKVLIIFIIAIAHELDFIFNNTGIRYLVIIFYIINEGISIIENASILGLPIPKKIKNTLNTLKTDHK